MSIYFVVPLLAVVALVQTTIVPRLTVWGVFANLPLLFVVSWGLLRGRKEGAVWGFVAGLAVDLFSGAPFGAATLALMASGFLAGLGAASILHAHFALPLAVAFLATVVYGLCFMAVMQIAGQPVIWWENFWRILLPSAALNAVLMPLVLLPMRSLYDRFHQQDVEW